MNDKWICVNQTEADGHICWEESCPKECDTLVLLYYDFSAFTSLSLYPSSSYFQLYYTKLYSRLTVGDWATVFPINPECRVEYFLHINWFCNLLLVHWSSSPGVTADSSAGEVTPSFVFLDQWGTTMEVLIGLGCKAICTKRLHVMPVNTLM